MEDDETQDRIDRIHNGEYYTRIPRWVVESSLALIVLGLVLGLTKRLSEPGLPDSSNVAKHEFVEGYSRESFLRGLELNPIRDEQDRQDVLKFAREEFGLDEESKITYRDQNLTFGEYLDSLTLAQEEVMVVENRKGRMSEPQAEKDSPFQK